MTVAAVYDLYQQGLGLLRARQAVAAVEVLELAVESEPSSKALHEALGRAYFLAARVPRAQAEFEQVLQLDPTDDYAHFGAGRCHERLGRLRPAVKHYRMACALAPRADYVDALARVEERLD